MMLFGLYLIIGCKDTAADRAQLSEIKQQESSEPTDTVTPTESETTTDTETTNTQTATETESTTETETDTETETTDTQTSTDTETTDPDPTTDDTGPFTTLTKAVTADQYGYIDIPVQISSDATSIMMSIEADNRISLLWIENQNGQEVVASEDWNGTAERLSGSFFVNDAHNVMVNWPVRQADPSLSAGTWYFVFYSWDSSDAPIPYEDYEATIHIKQDNNLNQGTVKVAIFYAQNVQNNSAVTTAVTQAITQWQSLWSQWGLQLDYRIDSSTLNSTVPDPNQGSTTYRDLANQTDEDEIIVVIGESISGQPGLLGISGGIPGTSGSTSRSATAISWLNAAGPDGAFDSIDIRLLAETFAHETGHFMGLYHPVETDWYYIDALSDTPNCGNQSSCESQLDDNLMFPYPICDASNCTPQDTLSNQQRGVLHRYTATQ